MGEVPEIVDLEKVLEPQFGDGEVISYTSRYLTKPGDNYGSLMLSVNAKVKKSKSSDTVEDLKLVVKIPPITNEFYWKVFQPERTCLTEITVYKHLGPAFRNLQMDCGWKEEELFDSLADYYGSRISLDPNAKVVDRDALLILENVQVKGYKAGNRKQMYDEAHTKFVLQELAKFHALAIALRLKKPKFYDEFVRPNLTRFNINKNFTKEELDDFNGQVFNEIELATNNNINAVERVKQIGVLQEAHCKSPDTKDGPYATIAHSDLWINNIMFKYDEAGNPMKLKFVDFQIAVYDSLAHDIFFFLFSSVDMQVLEAHYDDFLKFYYENFIECLQKLSVDTKVYSYQSFLKEIERIAPIELWHALFMTKIILADSSNIPDNFDELDLSVINKNTGVAEITKKTAEILHLAEKLKFF